MDFAIFAPKKLLSVGAVIACAVGLSGCFDLGQKVAIGRDGSGGYAISVAADGIVGDGLRQHHAKIDVGGQQLASRIAVVDGKTVQTSGTAFHDLSDLRLGDETISLHVKGQKMLGLLGTQVEFHRSFNIDRARHRNMDDDDNGNLGHDILTSMFGDHTYTFSVWLPGTIDHINPVMIGDQEVKPTVTQDGDGHTVTWRMKLADMFLANELDFDVDFTAHGNFHDAQTQYDSGHRHHRDET
jgi:hypothetical protein